MSCIRKQPGSARPAMESGSTYNAASITLTGVRVDETFLTRHFELDQARASLLIGRSSSRSQHERGSPESANAYFTCPVVSRRHAKLYLENGQIWIKDLGSLHGTAVNGIKCSANRPSVLENNDIVSVGNTILEGPQKHLAVVFQVHIRFTWNWKPSETARMRSFVDLSSPAPSPRATAALAINADRLLVDDSDPNLGPPVAAPRRETFSVPEVESPEGSSDSEDEDLVITEAPVVGRKDTSNFTRSVSPDRIVVESEADHAEAAEDADNADDAEQEEDPLVFTPSSSAMSSPPSSPMVCDANDASEGLSCVPEIKSSTATNNDPSMTDAFPAHVDKQLLPCAAQASELAFSRPIDAPLWQAPERQNQNQLNVSDFSGYSFGNSPQPRIGVSNDPEYHSFYPVHGLSQGSAPGLSHWCPSESLSTRMRGGSILDQTPMVDAVSDPYAAFPDFPYPPPLSRIGSRPGKDPVMSIDNIVSRDSGVPPVAPPTTTGSGSPLKRKAGAVEKDTMTQVEELQSSANGKQEQPDHDHSVPSKPASRSEGQERPRKKSKSEAFIEHSPRTSTRTTQKTKRSLGQFALGALAGGVGVLGALAFLPDSVFF